ncbi:MAG: glucose-1-phosphate cytidylyltransferase [Cellvibrionales bacterium TMED122]|nr:MAG: glucose-1-phosphate cytidylyltransferase [Cellvibrionales bacterium TMED122]|tara:strand:- start:1373 stop:2143 length:771 start_codon:yes stop_codon:yes gene_type:complete
MQVVILAGGRGTRISEESLLRPKPLIEIGERPIIWHIMKTYSYHGINDFIICCGYKGELIKEYFSNFGLYSSDMTIEVRKNKITFHKKNFENWKITLIDTGSDTQTGGRIKRVRDYLNNTFCFTYGDGLSDVNIKKSIEFHKKNKKIATMTVVQPAGRFGAVKIKKNLVEKFSEKPVGDGGWINGGFFVLEKKSLDYIKDDYTIWEQEPLKNLSKQNQLSSFKHKGFWHPMDTIRDKEYLEEEWRKPNCPWKKWNV